MCEDTSTAETTASSNMAKYFGFEPGNELIEFGMLGTNTIGIPGYY